MMAQDFGDLAADAHDRVQGRQRILEHDRDLATADGGRVLIATG
jgi:hypothetical protein